MEIEAGRAVVFCDSRGSRTPSVVVARPAKVATPEGFGEDVRAFVIFQLSCPVFLCPCAIQRTGLGTVCRVIEKLKLSSAHIRAPCNRHVLLSAEIRLCERVLGMGTVLLSKK